MQFGSTTAQTAEDRQRLFGMLSTSKLIYPRSSFLHFRRHYRNKIHLISLKRKFCNTQFLPGQFIDKRHFESDFKIGLYVTAATYIRKITVCIEVKVTAIVEEPDRLFHCFRASRSGDRRVLSSSGMSCDRF